MIVIIIIIIINITIIIIIIIIKGMLLRDAVVFEFQTLLNLNVAVSKVNTCLVASKFAFRLVTSLEIDEVIATSLFD